MSKDRSQEAVVACVVELLKAERKRQGISMNKLAERSGLSHSTISLIENDLRSPSLEIFLRIAAALEVDLWKILKEADSRK